MGSEVSGTVCHEDVLTIKRWKKLGTAVQTAPCLNSRIVPEIDYIHYERYAQSDDSKPPNVLVIHALRSFSAWVLCMPELQGMRRVRREGRQQVKAYPSN